MKKQTIIVILGLILTAQAAMTQQKEEYYFSKTLMGSFEEITKNTKAALKEQGFGVITEIDMDVKLKEKLDGVKLKPYKILGVCNPAYAYQTIQAEENIGLFLPCKVLIKDKGNGEIEVVMVNATTLMHMLGNSKLDKPAAEVTKKFKAALEKL